MKPLTQKEVLKKHKKNPKDKELHKTIETKEVRKEVFDKLVRQGIKQQPFDKKK